MIHILHGKQHRAQFLGLGCVSAGLYHFQQCWERESCFEFSPDSRPSHIPGKCLRQSEMCSPPPIDLVLCCRGN